MSHLDYEINKELGECYLFMGDLDKAEEYYVKAVDASAQAPQAEPFVGLATIRVQRGEFVQARDLYVQAVAAQPAQPSDKALTGQGLMELELGDAEAAWVSFSRALDANPLQLLSLSGLVRAATVLGRLPEAVDRMEEYLSAKPEDLDVRFSLAGCLVNLGRQHDAERELDGLLARNPGHQAARDLLGRLGRLAA